MASPDERRVSRALAKLGLRLRKSRRRAELSIDDRGGYAVQQKKDGRFVCTGNFGLTLDEARAFVVLARRGKLGLSPLDMLEFDDLAVASFSLAARPLSIRDAAKKEEPPTNKRGS